MLSICEASSKLKGSAAYTTTPNSSQVAIPDVPAYIVTHEVIISVKSDARLTTPVPRFVSKASENKRPQFGMLLCTPPTIILVSLNESTMAAIVKTVVATGATSGLVQNPHLLLANLPNKFPGVRSHQATPRPTNNSLQLHSRLPKHRGYTICLRQFLVR